MKIHVGDQEHSPAPVENQATKPEPPVRRKPRYTFMDYWRAVSPLPWIILILILLRIFG